MLEVSAAVILGSENRKTRLSELRVLHKHMLLLKLLNVSEF